MRISDKDGIRGTVQDQYIRLNGREVLAGNCPECGARCFASASRTLRELDGTIHQCEVKP